MLFCLTANHRNTDFDVLERISHVTQSTAADLLHTYEFVRGAIVLSTCNRFEAYLELDEPVTAGAALAHQAVLDVLRETTDGDADALDESAAALVGDDVVH